MASGRLHWPSAAARHLDSVLRCERGSLSIVVLGGSMTEGQLAGGRCPPCLPDVAHRWSTILQTHLRSVLANVPGGGACDVRVHNRAARATTIEHVLHHHDRIFSGEAATPDVVLIDYALNDYKHGNLASQQPTGTGGAAAAASSGSGGSSAADAHRRLQAGFEAAVRLLRALPSSPAVVDIETFYPFERAAFCALPPEAEPLHLPVCEHYAVPVVSFAAAVCPAFRRDRRADRHWETRDNVVHPTAYTHALLAKIVAAALLPSNSGSTLSSSFMSHGRIQGGGHGRSDDAGSAGSSAAAAHTAVQARVDAPPLPSQTLLPAELVRSTQGCGAAPLSHLHFHTTASASAALLGASGSHGWSLQADAKGKTAMVGRWTPPHRWTAAADKKAELVLRLPMQLGGRLTIGFVRSWSSQFGRARLWLDDDEGSGVVLDGRWAGASSQEAFEAIDVTALCGARCRTALAESSGVRYKKFAANRKGPGSSSSKSSSSRRSSGLLGGHGRRLSVFSLFGPRSRTHLAQHQPRGSGHGGGGGGGGGGSSVSGVCVRWRSGIVGEAARSCCEAVTAWSRQRSSSGGVSGASRGRGASSGGRGGGGGGAADDAASAERVERKKLAYLLETRCGRELDVANHTLHVRMEAPPSASRGGRNKNGGGDADGAGEEGTGTLFKLLSVSSCASRRGQPDDDEEVLEALRGWST